MTVHEKIAFKNKLKQLCESLIQERIDALKINIKQAQEAANNEEKSSAGDKYETSRAMSQIEREMHARQLGEVLKELKSLNHVNVNRIYQMGEPGSLIRCAEISFFIAAGLGKQRVTDDIMFFLSPNAPLARTLMNNKTGDHMLFNHVQMEILEIY